MNPIFVLQLLAFAAYAFRVRDGWWAASWIAVGVGLLIADRLWMARKILRAQEAAAADPRRRR